MSTQSKEYTAIIPVAGKGVRLLPYTAHCPKTMLDVAGEPIIAHILRQVERCGIKRIVFIVGYQKESLIEFVRSHYTHLDVSFVEQTEQKGLGHAIYLAKEMVQGPCLIVLGDTIIDGELKPLIDSGKNAVCVKQVADARRFGVVEMQEGHIIGFEEKPEHPKSNLALIGAYSFLDSAQLFSALEEVIASGKTVKNEIQLTDALSVLLNRQIKIIPVEIQNWFDCGTAEILLETNRILLERQELVSATVPSNTKVIKPCYIAPGAVIENCVLGPYVSVSEGAVLKNCVLKDAIISRDAHVENVAAEHTILDKYSY